MLDPSGVAYHPFVGAWALADLIEAAVHTDKREEVHRYLTQLESLAAKISASYLRATLAYARAAAASEDEADALYQAALSSDLRNWPCFRGRLLLSYGRWLRWHRARPAFGACSESHLYRIFPKLGTQLRLALPDMFTSKA